MAIKRSALEQPISEVLSQCRYTGAGEGTALAPQFFSNLFWSPELASLAKTLDHRLFFKIRCSENS